MPVHNKYRRNEFLNILAKKLVSMTTSYPELKKIY